MSNDILKLIYEKEKQNQVIFEAFDSLMSADIDEFISQPIEGLLYDLNRDKATCATWIQNDKTGWVNNYAVALVITRLKEFYDTHKEK